MTRDDWRKYSCEFVGTFSLEHFPIILVHILS